MKMIKRLERLKNTVNKYMADLRPDRLMTYQSERKLVISQQPGVLAFRLRIAWETVFCSSCLCVGKNEVVLLYN
jgi:hypothetical protein